MVKILNCYLNAKKSYGTLSKGAIFFLVNPAYWYDNTTFGCKSRGAFAYKKGFSSTETREYLPIMQE